MKTTKTAKTLDTTMIVVAAFAFGSGIAIPLLLNLIASKKSKK